ncbi:MAG: cyclic lactone autoinducer peptide [Lachnospiraceae bacterium]|nr:cyclic lactone autoinducer peptide [Lachnospiraceae bacterium]
MKNLVNKSIKKVTEKNMEKNANSLCHYFFHEPKAPANLKKFSKIK